MDDFLVKPFDDRQMAQLLSRWLTQRTAAEPNNSRPLPVSPADNATQQIIDETVIKRIRALDRKGRASRLERAVSQFTSIAPVLVATIHEKSEGGDPEALWRAAHSLKSSAGALGATILSKHCAEIEAAARNSGIEPAKPLIETLDEDLADAVRCLQSLIGVGGELVEHEK